MRCPSQYLNNTRYTFPQGLIQDYFMFGDEQARQASAIVRQLLHAGTAARHGCRGCCSATGDYAGMSFIYLGCSAYADGTPDLDNLISHAFGYAYCLTGAQVYRTLGTSLFNTSVTHGVTASHKH